MKKILDCIAAVASRRSIRQTRSSRRSREGRALHRLLSALAALSLPAATAFAQGSGPADLGGFGYVVIGVWLFFWVAVVVYPIALIIYFVRRRSDSGVAAQDSNAVGPSRGAKYLGRSIIVHFIITLGALSVFVFD